MCKANGIGHIINNAYGVQTSKSMHLIIEVCLSTHTRHTTRTTHERTICPLITVSAGVQIGAS
jgi:hypothetical protein